MLKTSNKQFIQSLSKESLKTDEELKKLDIKLLSYCLLLEFLNDDKANAEIKSLIDEYNNMKTQKKE